LFPGYDRFIANPESAEREKALLFLQELFPNQMRKEACLKGIVSLEIGREAAPHIRKADLQETMRHLIMSTLFQLPFHHEKTAPILKQVAWSLPCHHLTLGRDLGANLRAIRELI
jgi:hypothetical protein